MGVVTGAFLLGIASASPLVFGALTARWWKPTNFVLGLLTAFGAGALLSAVTIDIVAPSVEAGDFAWLALGAVAGGAVFEALNRAINARGGFLRKASTSITFLRDREQRRRRSILQSLERIEIFDRLPERELEAIAEAFRPTQLHAGDLLYRHGDHCEHLNVISKGEILLAMPTGDVRLHPYQAFGYQAFVSGLPHRSSARATVDSEVLRLSRSRLRSVLGTCPTFGARLCDRAHSEDLSGYLRTHHPEIGDHAIASWRRTIDADGMDHLPPLAGVASTASSELLVDHLASIEPFRQLSRRVVARLAHVMYLEEHEAGYVFFRPGDRGDRLYVIADGDVSLIDASGGAAEGESITTGDEIGLHSFATGLHHSATAVAQSPCDVWVVRRSDFDEIVDAEPVLRRALADFLESGRISRYLEREQRLGPDAAATAVRRARADVRRGSLPRLPSGGMSAGAPIAIWLGLMLDGIPESLVIGATAGAIRLSFVVGIALSNYPEALASSVGMREQGFAWRNIGLLWGTVVLVTGVGAAAGSVVFEQAPEQTFSIVEGIAAGAMLTVITQTMMPEALHRSGGFVGLAGLGGFLVTTALSV